MKKVLRILLIFSCSINATALMGQGNRQYYQIQQELKFKDGLYANIDMVMKNSPIPDTWIETDMDVNDRDFYKNIIRADEIVFFDDNGIRSYFDAKSIWGYSRNGELHINVGGAFHKINIFGRISHFFASKTTFYPNPFMSQLDFWSAQPILVTEKREEYLVDILDNKLWKFDLEGLERVLKLDTLLWDEYVILKKKEKKQLKYIFLNRYNAKYPLDFPIY